jgi:hypothetical protein
MKRHTDVSRLRSALLQETAETGAQPSGCDAAIERATALLVLSMRQSDTPISELGGALARMARTLNDTQTDPQALRDAMARDICVCIQSLQFHDRLMQQLTHARDLLTGIATDSLLAQLPPASANEGSLEGSVELF